jgi:acyl-CoA thioesterase FadM
MCDRSQLGWGCFTLNLNVDYHKFIPLGSTVRFECTLDRIEGKKAFIECQFMNLTDDVVHSKAKVRLHLSRATPAPLESRCVSP